MLLPGMAIENLKLVPAFVPLDGNGVGWTGDWFSLKAWKRCLVMLCQGAWAAGTAAVTLLQATSNAGAGSKALAFTQRYTYVALVDDIPALTAVTSNTFNLPAVANTVNLIEVDGKDLDINNGFYYFSVSIATPGANADLCAGWYLGYDGDFAGLPSTLPPVISG